MGVAFIHLPIPLQKGTNNLWLQKNTKVQNLFFEKPFSNKSQVFNIRHVFSIQKITIPLQKGTNNLCLTKNIKVQDLLFETPFSNKSQVFNIRVVFSFRRLPSLTEHVLFGLFLISRAFLFKTLENISPTIPPLLWGIYFLTFWPKIPMELGISQTKHAKFTIFRFFRYTLLTPAIKLSGFRSYIRYRLFVPFFKGMVIFWMKRQLLG